MAMNVDETIRNEVSAFLMREAELLDDQKFEEWLEKLTQDVVYQVPIRSGYGRDESTGFPGEGAWFYENFKSLDMRVRRLRTPGVLAEDPPSRTRHFVSNIRIDAGDRDDEVAVKSNVLVYRSRGESIRFDLFSGERKDILRCVDGSWKLAHRELRLDQTVLAAQDLSIIL